MNTNQKKRGVIVGLFVLVGIAILLATIFTLGGQKKTFANGIPVYAVFDNVNGLQAGNNIWFSGVKVGTVRRLGLLNGGRVEVDMSIDPKTQSFIHRDAKVKIGSDGLIGNKIIVIYGGSETATPVQAHDTLQFLDEGGTAEMMSTLQSNNQNLLAITTDLKEISKHLAAGQGTIGKLLTDDALMNQLQATAASMKKASSNLQALTSDVAGYTSKLDTKGALANELVTDTAVFASVRESVSRIQAASQDAKSITENLRAVAEKINDSSNTVGVLLHDQKAADNLKATVENLQQGTQKFDENMEALQHNFLFRGFFRKKAKREKEQEKTSMVNGH